ncbi:hard surface-induced protein [Apiospora saccharicola]|uniref:Hard surface-induced protein n=1 Tax=Apiospora saccharicola TaxID=335842 RepID=A0ABR1ULX3_9PEZI
MPHQINASPQSTEYHLMTTSSSTSDDGHPQEEESILVEAELHETSSGHAASSLSRKPGKGRLRQALIELLPSFLHPSSRQHGGEEPPRPMSSTAWLDGLRGYAAFFVVWHHISLLWFSWSLHDGYAGLETDHLLQLPILRLAISGPPHVFIFFVVSGYALSHKTLRLLRATNKPATEESYAALASSAFRRHPRLFIPPVVLNLPTVLIAYAGLFGGSQEGGGQMPGAALKSIDPKAFETLGAQLGDYVRTALELVDPLAHRPDWPWAYNPATWTLPHEFHGSLLVYGVLLALSRCKNSVRLLAVVGVASWALYFVYWPEFLFLGGILLADLRLQSRRGTQEAGEEDEEKSSTISGEWKPAGTCSNTGWKSVVSRTASNRYLQTTIQITMYVLALYVLGAPKWDRGGDKASGYVWLAQLVPSQYVAAGKPDHFWGPIAAVALIFILDRSPLLQRLFTTAVAKYLGRISYSLYLVHGPLLHCLGWWAGKFFLGFTGSGTNSSYVLGVTCAVIVLWVVTIWVADLGWRYVDAPAVRFAAWVHRKVALSK